MAAIHDLQWETAPRLHRDRTHRLMCAVFFRSSISRQHRLPPWLARPRIASNPIGILLRAQHLIEKIHALFHNLAMQRSAVWTAVLLIHLFLWIALKMGADIPRPRQNASTYLPIALIGFNGSSAPAPQSVKDSLTDISKISTISPPSFSPKRQAARDIEIPGRKIAVPQMHKEAKESATPEEISTLEKAPSQPIGASSSQQANTLDIDAMKQIARSVGHASESRQLPGADQRLSGAEKFAESIDRAHRGDCRLEHAQLGLLAIPFLLKDAITGDGCKW